MPESFQPYLDFIQQTAYQAGKITLNYYQSSLEVNYKADRSPVTIADRLAEEFIRGQIEKRFPSHAILGEEQGARESEDASHRWIIDPIDGTKSFLRGVPLYGVLIALEIGGRVEVGAAYYPALDEMLAAASGMGCFWNGRRAQVSSIRQLKDSYMSCTDPGGFRKLGQQKVYDRLAQACYFRPGWGDAYGYLLVATGRAEIMIDPKMEAWDCGPFPPIFREAGGYFGDWQGNETIYAGEALATTQALLPEVLSTIRG